jgi:hypothetical protein
MITDIYAQPTRHLMQPGADMYLDMETAAALAAAGASKQLKLPMKTAKLLISNNQAASIECPTVAYPAVGASINTTVGVALVSASVLAADAKATAAAAAGPSGGNGTAAAAAAAAAASANALGGSRLSLTFPYFETLYYDPVVSFGDIDGMQVNDITPKGNCTGVVCGRAPERRVNAAAPRVGVTALQLLAGAAAVALAGLWW